MGVNKLQNSLICPSCGSEKLYCKQTSISCSCSKKYRIINGVPIMLLDSQKNLIEGLSKTNPWYYQEQLKEFTQGQYRHHLKKRIKYLKSLLERLKINKGKKILDCGCGDGVNFSYLFDCSNNEVYGTDYNLIRLSRARQNSNGNANLVASDVIKGCFKDDFFDFVFLNHVLEHIEMDVDALNSIYRILKNGGILVIGVPNEGAILYKLQYNLFERKLLKTTDHKQFYTVKSIVNKIKKHTKFKVIEIKRMGFGFPHSTVDRILRQFKPIDDFFDILCRLIPSQCSSLYIVLKK